MCLSNFCLFGFGISFHTFFVYVHIYSFVFVYSPLVSPFFPLFTLFTKSYRDLLLFFLESASLFCEVSIISFG
jgi:hypothetical protein